MNDTACRVCGSATGAAGTVDSRFSGRPFHLRHCESCRFSFVQDPRTDYEDLYAEGYYRGKGADPSVDYFREMSDPRTVRSYEWQGVLDVVRSLVDVDPSTEWLDYGCGLGGLVRYGRDRGIPKLVGFDVGYAARQARAMGIEVLDPAELERAAGKFKVVTAIEVLEHMERPLDALRDVHRALAQGGLFFFTTGNAAPFRGKLSTWHYVCPEVHVSFFEPQTMDRALSLAGFRAEHRALTAPYEGIIRYKVLKRLGVPSQNPLEGVLPWGIMTRTVDRRLKVSAHPIGWK
jgi:SAM-dependent methyltransferase